MNIWELAHFLVDRFVCASIVLLFSRPFLSFSSGLDHAFGCKILYYTIRVQSLLLISGTSNPINRSVYNEARYSNVGVRLAQNAVDHREESGCIFWRSELRWVEDNRNDPQTQSAWASLMHLINKNRLKIIRPSVASNPPIGRMRINDGQNDWTERWGRPNRSSIDDNHKRCTYR